MSTPLSLLSVAPSSLHFLRAAVLDAHGADGVPRLQEAGYATGEALYDALAAELREADVPEPSALPAERFTAVVSALLTAHGWGHAELERRGSAALVVTLADGPESDGEGAGGGCPFTTGVLSGLLSAVAGSPVAVLAVECCAPDAPRQCRFVAASPATVQAVWEAQSRGEAWSSALG